MSDASQPLFFPEVGPPESTFRGSIEFVSSPSPPLPRIKYVVEGDKKNPRLPSSPSTLAMRP